MALEHKLDQVKGAVKENVGKLTGDKKMEVEGVVEKTAAKVKDVANDVAEDVKDAVDGAINGIKNLLNKEDK